MKQEIIQNILNSIVVNSISGLSSDGINQYNSLATYLLQPTVKPKDLGLTYATIKYWEEKGHLILPLIKEKDEWRKYTVVEALWFYLLKKVVDMGCSLEKVAPQLIFAYANCKSPNDTILFNAEVPPLVIMDGVRVTPFINFLSHILLMVLGKAKATINLTNQGVNLFMDNPLNPGLAAHHAQQNVYTTSITICISDIVLELVLGLQEDLQHSHILSAAEIAVFKAMKDKKICEINIKRDKGKTYQMSTVENLGIKETALSINKVVTNKNQVAEIKTNDNKGQVAVKVTSKYKFK